MSDPTTDALRAVYEAARRVLRFNGVDGARAVDAIWTLDSAIERVKELDGGTADIDDADDEGLPAAAEMNVEIEYDAMAFPVELRELARDTMHNYWLAGYNARVDEIESQGEVMATALRSIKQWSEAYPLEGFPEQDLKRAHELLQASGMTLDAISAGAMRHVIKQVQEIADAALAKQPDQR